MIAKIKEHKTAIRKSGFWIFAIAGALFFIIIEDVAVEPFYSFSVFFYFVILAFWAIRWLINQRRGLADQKTEQSRTELLHLKSQVSPHFFFNMLNSLYGLIDKDPQKARTLILKLSDMMRYSIYEGQNEHVTLEDEVAYLNNYIGLQKMRYHKKIDIDFQINIKSGYQVMPLLFIILLENAFKHGVENLSERAYVHLTLTAAADEIHFVLKNNFDGSAATEEQGIGLHNLKRRLELAYKNKHQLTLSQHNNEYRAELRLKNL